jgi:hypothetical protein
VYHGICADPGQYLRDLKNRFLVADDLGEDGTVATSSVCSFSIGAAAPAAGAGRHASRRRRISPDAGRALEILGHAIEYLTDEFVHTGGALSAHDPQVQAVQLLMGINREIYFNCPEVPSLVERFRAWMRLRTA